MLAPRPLTASVRLRSWLHERSACEGRTCGHSAGSGLPIQSQGALGRLRTVLLGLELGGHGEACALCLSLPGNTAYHCPATLDEAFDLLERYGSDGCILAGGQSLVPVLNMRLAAPNGLG